MAARSVYGPLSYYSLGRVHPRERVRDSYYREPPRYRRYGPLPDAVPPLPQERKFCLLYRVDVPIDLPWNDGRC